MMVVFAVCLSIGCEIRNDRSIRDSRESFMAELKEAMTMEGIPYRQDSNGNVIYSAEHESEVDLIAAKIELDLSKEVGSIFDDKVSLNIFCRILEENNIQYRTEPHGRNTRVYWRPLNKAQENVIEERFVSLRSEARQLKEAQ
jgi:hypothetical protein